MSKKELETENLFKQQSKDIVELLDNFVEVVRLYFINDKKYNELAFEVHEQEHNLDTIRRKIEQKLYEGAYLPFFRQDYIKLAELMDAIANNAELVCDHFVMEQPEMVKELEGNVPELAGLVRETYSPMIDIFSELLSNKNNVGKLCQKVSENEQKVDKAEWKTINFIFTQATVPLANKIINREFVEHIAKVSDVIEDAADWIRVMIIKRHI